MQIQIVNYFGLQVESVDSGTFALLIKMPTRNDAKQQKWHEINKGNWKSVDFKVNIGARSPKSMQEQLQNTSIDQNQLCRKNVWLEAHCVIDDANKEFTDDTATLELFHKTMTNLSRGKHFSTNGTG